MTDLLESPIPAIPDQAIGDLGRRLFGLSGSFRHLGGERDLNLVFDEPDGRYALKVANVAEPRAVIEMQAAVLEHLAAVDSALPVPRLRRSLGGAAVEEAAFDGVGYSLRLVTFIEGELPVAPVGRALCRSMGATLGRLQRALSGFFHPEAGRPLLWDARNAARLIPWVGDIESPALRSLCGEILSGFAASSSRLAAMPAQVIHNDFHFGNLLTSGAADEIVGVIDFGDMIHGTRIQDLSVAVAYGVLGADDPLAGAMTMVDAFLGHVDLTPAEVEALDDLVMVRFAQSIAIGARRAVLHPENSAYISADTPLIEDLVVRWSQLDRGVVREAFGTVAGIPPGPSPSDSLRARRRRVLSPMLSTSYDSPLHLVRGDGVWLFDADGNRYLDAYNNVVQLGHAHPRVVRAVAAQSALLNTNTRYLTDGIVEYAERLIELLPPALSVCFFVNSGTEANDLAWRMAKAVSANSGAIITDFAYHGWTEAVMAMSPEELDGRPLQPWVASIAPPASGIEVASEVEEAMDRLASAGHRPAAALIDSAFSSDGIFDLPPGYHHAVASAVRSAGGVFIADEVQGGMGRVGRRFWGFAADDFVPDIVTLGKPIGNGFPMGAVVTTPSVAERFADEAYFFSTFGGNPVAAAAGRAVIDVTSEDGLAARADAVGAELRSGLAGLLSARGIGGEVRGAGLFTGVDVGDPALAHLLVEGMKAAGVLVSATGPSASVLKIRPPLVFDRAHAGLLLAAFERATASL